MLEIQGIETFYVINLIKMEISIADQYYLKAFGEYPYELGEVCDNLNYALSYDEYHAPSLVLKGRLFMEQMKSYSKAKACFEMALAFEPDYAETYEYYSLLCIWCKDYEKAQKLIDDSYKIVGINIYRMRIRQAKLYEYMGRYEQAYQEMKDLEKISSCYQSLDYFQSEKKRLKNLIKMRRKK